MNEINHKIKLVLADFEDLFLNRYLPEQEYDKPKGAEAAFHAAKQDVLDIHLTEES